MANADRRGGAGDAGEVVVFGEPEALVSSGFGVSGQVRGVVQRVGRRKPFTDIGEVEDGEIYHIGLYPVLPPLPVVRIRASKLYLFYDAKAYT